MPDWPERRRQIVVQVGRVGRDLSHWRHRPTWRRFERPLLAGLPYALILGLGLGFGVMVGANLSHAMPSEDRPFGWPGQADYNGGVAMDRSVFVLAASVPGLVLGIYAAWWRREAPMAFLDFGATTITHLSLLFGGSFLGAWIGDLAVARTPDNAFVAFAVSHALLSCAFYSLAVGSGILFRSFGPAVAGALWVFYTAIYENLVRWHVLREIGYPGLQNGTLPAWFFAAQALSPISLYRALLIVWHPGFRNYEEQAVLKDVVLPPWMNPGTLGLVLALWTAGPLLAASVLVSLRSWLHHRAVREKTPLPRTRPVEYRLVDPSPVLEGFESQRSG